MTDSSVAMLPLFSQPSSERNFICVALDRAFADLPVGQTLTAESIRDQLSFPVREALAVPSRKNLMGAWFKALAKRGVVQPDGWTEAQRDDARHRALRRWRKVAV